MNSRPWRNAVVALYGLGMATSISLAQAAGYLLVVSAAVDFGRGRRSWPAERPPLALAAGVFFVWGLVCTVLAGAVSIGSAAQAQSPMVLFLLSVYGLNADENIRWLRWLGIGAAVGGGIALVQAAIGIDRIPTFDQYLIPGWLPVLPSKLVAYLSLRDGRAVATRSHPLTFAETLMVAVFFLIAAPFWEGRRDGRRRLAAVALTVAGIVFSLSRGAWLGLAGGLVLIAVRWRNRRTVRLWAAIGLAAAVVSIAAVPKIRTRALSIVTARTAEAKDQGSRSTRFILWSAARAKVAERPLVGHGIRGFFMTITEPGATAPRVWSEAHNIYIQILGERGVVGLGLFLWLLLVAIRGSLAAGPGWREAGLAALVSLMVAGITESWVHDGEVGSPGTELEFAL